MSFVNNQIITTPVDQITWLATMMAIDGNIHKKEFEEIIDYGTKLGLEESRISKIVSNSIKNKKNLFQYLKLSDLPRNDDLMRALIRVVYADGKIAQQEIQMLKLVANKMQISGNDLKNLLEDEKRKFILKNQQKS